MKRSGEVLYSLPNVMGIAFGLSVCGELFGVPDILMQVLGIVVVIDFLAGMLRAFIVGERLVYRKFFIGVLKKLGYVLLVVLSHQMDVIAASVDTNVIRNTAVFSMIIYETASALRNFYEADIFVPKVLKDFIESKLNK